MPKEENISVGRISITRECCGSATCRNYAPSLLGEMPSASAARDGHRLQVLPEFQEPGAFTGVKRQPQDEQDLVAARTAAASCPFGAIRLRMDRPRGNRERLPAPWSMYPKALDRDVWVLGRPSVKNFGATAYFIEAAGGVLIDPPRPTEEVFEWLSEHGGVRWLFLTHRDHTHHHEEFARRFKCRRILGADDIQIKGSKYMAATGDVEVQIGSQLQPLSLEGRPLTQAEAEAAELFLLPQPGHTPGSLCLSYRGRFFFTGDHLIYSRMLGHIAAFRLQCWEDWERQTRSVRYLVAAAEQGWLRFSWILPGHGEWYQLPGGGTQAETAAALRSTVEWMERQPKGHTPLPRWIAFALSRSKPKSTLSRVARALGDGNENWILPRTAWSSLPDHDASLTAVTVRRLLILGIVGAATVGVLAISAIAMGMSQ